MASKLPEKIPQKILTYLDSLYKNGTCSRKRMPSLIKAEFSVSTSEAILLVDLYYADRISDLNSERDSDLSEFVSF